MAGRSWRSSTCYAISTSRGTLVAKLDSATALPAAPLAIAVRAYWVGPIGTDVDLSAAWLERDGKQFAFARDAQAASHLKAHVALVNGDGALTAYFEVPVAGLGPGLTLVVPDGSATAKLELQQ